MENLSFYRRAKRLLFGAPRDLFDPKIFHNISLIAFFAWVGLGADGISSSCYGPEEAFLALGSHAVLAIFVAVMSVATIFIISGSYAQIIEAFPSGGGYPWFLWPLGGWGVGLIFHFLGVFVFSRSTEWERKEIQKEMEKLRKSQP